MTDENISKLAEKENENTEKGGAEDMDTDLPPEDEEQEHKVLYLFPHCGLPLVVRSSGGNKGN